MTKCKRCETTFTCMQNSSLLWCHGCGYGSPAEREQRQRAERAEAKLSKLMGSLSKLMGPKCEDKDCPDHDGGHPYHENALEKAYEKGQVVAKELMKECKRQLETLKDVLRRLYETAQNRTALPIDVCCNVEEILKE